ncbi:serine/threonine protein kinase [Schlesneria sp. DSM 10557]|uniref:serine/threonine protein kinase n=1 Tax=Schlesneria sp. DSM 10557 TaxID=3044399 RepID=UPI0035A10FB7
MFNPLSYFRRLQPSSGSRSRSPIAHMTWDTSSFGRSVSRTGVFLKKQIWLWPIIATALLSLLAFGVHRAIEFTMKESLRSQLQTLLDVEIAMLENWIKTQSANATLAANDPRIRETIYGILEVHEAGLDQAPQTRLPELYKQLQKQMSPVMSLHDFVDYFVVDKSRHIIASSVEGLTGKKDILEFETFVAPAMAGETTICAPFASQMTMKDDAGVPRTGVPTMYVCAPLRDANFEVVAAVALRIRPEFEFTRILQLGRFGTSGETYAVNKSGLMVSNSRFDDSLILIGILADQPGIRSIVNIQVRDPQGDLTKGHRPNVRRTQLPLTRSAASIAKESSGIDLDGFRDYRGVTVIGAWKWMPEINLGVISEIDAAEAFQPLSILQSTFWVLHGLLGCCSIAIFVFTVMVRRLRRQAQKAEIEAQQLGQYTLEKKLAAGAMGVVYKGHHSMLRRETAIKMLDVDKVNDASLIRFEREVQITCKLNHPNTVAIYDYGRTPEGLFYYAMEYLDGINLQTLVENYGPQPEGRVIHILTHICGSLYEAHLLGLVHRDIKPANIMINRRGGETDVVKVLDFGLVKALDENKQVEATISNSLTGTPLYMAPEAIQAPNTVDGRSDLYAVGAVGYFLLTGKPVFDSSSLVELCQQHVETVPRSVSDRLGKPVSQELEHAIMACLEKSRNRRPATARDLADLLRRCPTAGTWSMDDADAWWSRHERGLGAVANTEKSRAYDRTIIGGMTEEQ